MIETYLEAYDGDKEVERTLYFEIYVPENISQEDYDLLKEEVEEAEEAIDDFIEYANKEENTSGLTTAKNADYSIRILKSGGNYDYNGNKGA